MDWRNRLSFFGERAQEIQKAVENSPYRREMEFLYETMPISDAANYPCACFEAYAAHAHFLREHAPWCAQLPEELYLHDVLYHRINNEDITVCRSTFYQLLWKQIEGKPMEEAIKIINYWCLKEATYRLTDDRTVSPLTVLRCAFGRCGEESTFTVTALRSVGIPARQVYSPKWPHCDDNHAWVEVWCDGRWRYLGACEPEEMLDRGWFTAASSRAMMIHSRTFQGSSSQDEYIAQEGCMKLWNQLSRYADTAVLSIHVHEGGKPCEGVLVKAELLNYAQFSPIALMHTDEQGRLSFTTGLGDLHLHLVKDGRFVTCKVDVRSQQQLEIDFAQAAVAEPDEPLGIDFEMHPPKDNMRFMTMQSEETKLLRQKKFDEAVAQRQKKEQGFLKEEQARELLLRAGLSSEQAERGARLCANAYGNDRVLLDFLTRQGGTALRIQLLESLTPKDLTDCEQDVLEEALQAAAWQDRVPERLFVPYVLCPRVGLEKLTLHRQRLPQCFSQQEWESFQTNPRTIGTWIREHITHHPEQEYEGLMTFPLALLSVRSGSAASQKLLFVSICRTLGIPARLAPDDGRVQFWDKAAGRFEDGMPKTQDEVRHPFTILSSEKEPWVYTQNWTISRLEDGQYVTLDFQDIPWQTVEDGSQRITLELQDGHYRLIVCKRMPTGALFAREYRFTTGAGRADALKIVQRTARLSDLLEDRELPDFDLYEEDGTPVHISTLTKGSPTLLLWLQEGEEPTQHILNELYDLREAFSAAVRLVFIVKNKDALAEKHIRRALSAQPGLRVLYDDFRDNRSALARRMYVDPDKLPMLVLTNRERNGIYAFSGYNVGMGDLLLKILREVHEG